MRYVCSRRGVLVLLSVLCAARGSETCYLCSSKIYRASIALMVRMCSCYGQACPSGDVRFALWGALWRGACATNTSLHSKNPCHELL